jgi:hypothetical protein
MSVHGGDKCKTNSITDVKKRTALCLYIWFLIHLQRDVVLVSIHGVESQKYVSELCKLLIPVCRVRSLTLTSENNNFPFKGSQDGFFVVVFLILVCEAIGTAATPDLLCQPRAIVKMIVEK